MLLLMVTEPAVNLMIHTVFDLFYRADIPVVTDISEAVYSFLKNSIDLKMK